LYYGSVEGVKASDHKPVHALFEAAVKTCMVEHRRRVVEDVCSQLKAMENRTLPRLSLTCASVPAGLTVAGVAGAGDATGGGSSGSTPVSLRISDAVFGVPASFTLELKNPSAVSAPWHILPKPEEQVLCKKWLTIDPPYGLLPPLASTILTVTITVDEATARDLSVGRELAASCLTMASARPGEDAAAGGLRWGKGVLEDILVLRAERGKDLFIPVSVTVLPTSWGSTLAQLARRPEPVRASGLTAAASAAMRGGGADPTAASRALAGEGGGDIKMAIPKEIWRIVDALVGRGPGGTGLGTPGLFLTPPDARELASIRSAIDCGDPLPPSLSPLSLAGALLDLLSSLREPVIPPTLFPHPGEVLGKGEAGIRAWCTHTLRSLPPLHYNVLVYLCRFLREVVASAVTTGASVTAAEELAVPFSRAIMRRTRHEEAPLHAHHGVRSGEGPVVESGLSIGRAPELGSLLGESAEDDGGDFADKGTRWEPSDEEGDAMKKCAFALLTNAPLGF